MCGDTPSGRYLNIQEFIKFYTPADPELAEGNENYTLDFLKRFYREAYARMRRHMGPDKYVVFHDAFELDIWDDFLLREGMEGVCLDTHAYLMTPDRMLFRERNAEVYRRYLRSLGEKLTAAGKRVPLIVGEWNAQNAADGLAAMTGAQKDALYGGVAESFQDAFSGTMGWFYWGWKILAEGTDADCDDACRCVTKGWLKIRNT